MSRYQKSYLLGKWTHHKRSACESEGKEGRDAIYRARRDSQSTVDYHRVNAWKWIVGIASKILNPLWSYENAARIFLTFSSRWPVIFNSLFFARMGNSRIFIRNWLLSSPWTNKDRQKSAGNIVWVKQINISSQKKRRKETFLPCKIKSLLRFFIRDTKRVDFRVEFANGLRINELEG